MLVVLASVCHGAHAASPPPSLPATLTQILMTPEHRAALLQAAHAVDGPGMPTCPSASYTTAGEIGILTPVRTDAAGRLTAGAWKETVQQAGCGATRLLNALTTVQPDGTLQTQPLLPGTTITDPRLQQDSVQYAAAGMGEMPPGCDQGGVLDTRFVGLDGRPPGTQPTLGGPPMPWTEVWTLIACSKRADITMHFTPDPTGTDVRADLAKQ